MATLGVSTIGLGGMLLPIAGFDQHQDQKGGVKDLAVSISNASLSK